MKRSSPKPTFISTITIKEYFVNRKMKHLDIGCQIRGCPNKAQFLIGSLTRELQGEEKWLSVCDNHEREIAEQNIRIVNEAEKRGIAVAEYVGESTTPAKAGGNSPPA